MAEISRRPFSALPLQLSIFNLPAAAIGSGAGGAAPLGWAEAQRCCLYLASDILLQCRHLFFVNYKRIIPEWLKIGNLNRLTMLRFITCTRAAHTNVLHCQQRVWRCRFETDPGLTKPVGAILIQAFWLQITYPCFLTLNKYYVVHS